MPAGKITVDLEARTAGWSKGLGDAGNDVKQFVNKAQSQFKALSFNSGNSFNAAGVAKFGAALEGVASKVTEVATDLRTGAGYGETFSKALDATPIVGSFKKAGEAIGELISGQKAAAIEAAKMNEHLNKMAAIYRTIAFTREGFGKHGDEKAGVDADAQTASAITALHEEREKINAALRDTKKHDAFIGWYSDAQKADMKRSEDALKANSEQIKLENQKNAQAKIEIEREASERLRAFTRGEEESRLGFEASAREKSLKRQGKALESAIEGVKASAAERIRAESDKLTEYALAGMSDKEKDARRNSVAATIASIQKDSEQTVGDLQAEDARRKQEAALDNVEKLKEIEARGGIERLKIQDENINASNELTGKAQRSHLAEAATIEEEYRKQVADIEKKAREEKSRGVEDPANTSAQMKAAQEQRKQQLGLLDTKGANETTKNQNTLLKEQRKLWEEAGDTQEKYKGKLADINEQFEKFHDVRLRNAQIDKLDKSTLESLKKLNPDNDPKVNLYGRTQSYEDLSIDHRGSDIAQQQFNELKKQSIQGDTNSRYFFDIWNYVQKLSGPVTELNI